MFNKFKVLSLGFLMIVCFQIGCTEDSQPQMVESRASRLESALLLLSEQPRTRANIDNADESLRLLIDECKNDDIGIAAAFFRARVAHLHFFEPDLSLALKLYIQLNRDYPHHYFGQMALTGEALIQLYDITATKEQQIESWGELTRRGDMLTHPDALRSFHLTMADAAGRFGMSDEDALTHLVQVSEIGLVTSLAEADVHVRIGVLAQRVGQVELAKKHYQLFLERFPSDARQYMARQRLVVLEKEDGLL